MFSLQIEASLNSRIGKKLPLIQHLLSLSIVESVKSLKDGYEMLDLCLKWPNDIYAGKEHKLGGVVVFTSVMGNLIQVCAVLLIGLLL